MDHTRPTNRPTNQPATSTATPTRNTNRLTDQVLAQSLLTAVDRDAMSGWGCVVKIMTPDRIITCVFVMCLSLNCWLLDALCARECCRVARGPGGITIYAASSCHARARARACVCVCRNCCFAALGASE